MTYDMCMSCAWGEPRTCPARLRVQLVPRFGHMTEVVTLILSSVCGAAIVLSLRRRTTDHRRRPTAPEAPSTLGSSGTLNVYEDDGRGASELRDPQQTSHSAPRGFDRPVACSADGRVLTDDLVPWHGPDRAADGRSAQPASEASSTPRRSASAHSARRLDRSRAKLLCSAERPSFAGAFTPPRPRRLPPPSPPPSPPAPRYASLRDHIPLFLLLGFLGLVAVGLFLALALTAPPSTSFSPPPAPVWHSPSPPPPSPVPPPPPSPTAQAATAAPGGGVALSPPELTRRDDGSAGDEARRPADASPPWWWWQSHGEGVRSRPASRPSHASPSHVGYVVVGGFAGAALALSSIYLRPRTRRAAAGAAADALAAAGAVQGAAETLGLLHGGGRAWRRALLGTAAAVLLVAPFVPQAALPATVAALPATVQHSAATLQHSAARLGTLKPRLPWTFAVRRPRPTPAPNPPHTRPTPAAPAQLAQQPRPRPRTPPVCP